MDCDVVVNAESREWMELWRVSRRTTMNVKKSKYPRQCAGWYARVVIEEVVVCWKEEESAVAIEEGFGKGLWRKEEWRRGEAKEGAFCH